ncbi:type II toxin-antitoxin system RelB/DinJ family antitoxin [Candidatus Saccharibacteria bacterium]|nr:type II toxin-antitoxin system RelB/DinJ family antitoxin [Candidatus Saccharibacteria bacterium]MBQ7040986.1 type II toxin-antitoxin system RelB/DinJ family antitoxin [Candidatus Saccharibacteria bacterium]
MNTTIAKTQNDTLIQVRVPADLKRRTAELFESLGTNTSAVIKMMLVRADETKSIPFKIHTNGYPISANEVIDEVAATFALEDMPLTEENIQNLRDIELGLKSPDQVRQELLADIKRRHKK